MLLFVIFGSWWLEFAFKIRVLRRPRLLFMAILPVCIVFLAWDAFAIQQEHWTFDSDQILGIFGPLNIPLEEYLFFIIIPIAAVLTLEGVKVVMKRFSR
jgi:lycopene cyclase domain-containing protein